jgi:DNA polymerase III subunit gamma/tau
MSNFVPRGHLAGCRTHHAGPKLSPAGSRTMTTWTNSARSERKQRYFKFHAIRGAWPLFLGRPVSYQVIARKWRPKKFSELIGQNHISQTLINALRAGRLPHALLFTGPRGTGKTSTARILAKSLRCPNAKDYVPCNECDECTEIASGRSVNVVEIDGASNNGVDSIRELRDAVAYMPTSGKFKIYIIDEVHMLSVSAFNALLKTLEEPPDNVIFVLATTEVHKIPSTILSRCQKFDFRRIPLRMITDHLRDICTQENIAVENEALWLIARQGEGSMRDSQSLLEQVISFADVTRGSSTLTIEKVTDVLGLTDRRLLTDTLTALVDRSPQAVMGIVERLYQSGQDPVVYAREFLEEVRHLLIVKLMIKDAASVLDLAQEEIEALRSLSDKLSDSDIHLLFDMALKGTQDVLRTQDPRVVLEMLLLRMAVAPRVVDLLRATPATPGPAVAPGPAKPQSSPPATTDRWLQFVDQVKKVNPAVAAKIEHLKVVSIDTKKVTVAVPEAYKFLNEQVKTAEFQKKITNYLRTFWGQDIVFEISTDGPSDQRPTFSATELKAAEAESTQRKIRQQVENHPLVKSIHSHFNVEITSIKERT